MSGGKPCYSNLSILTSHLVKKIESDQNNVSPNSQKLVHLIFLKRAINHSNSISLKKLFISNLVKGPLFY